MFKGFTTFGIVSFCMLLTSCRTTELAINEMQLNLRNNMLFITLYVNDKKGLFLVDTGAGISLIDYNQAKRYDFNIGATSNRGSVTGVGGSIALFTISDIDIMYNEFRTKDFRFYGSDFSVINDVFDRNRNGRVMPLDDHSQRISNQHEVRARLIHQLCKARIIGGQARNRIAVQFHSGQRRYIHRRLSHAALFKLFVH